MSGPKPDHPVTPLWVEGPEDIVLHFQKHKGSTNTWALTHERFFVRMSLGFSCPGKNSKWTNTGSDSFVTTMVGQGIPVFGEGRVWNSGTVNDSLVITK